LDLIHSPNLTTTDAVRGPQAGVPASPPPPPGSTSHLDGTSTIGAVATASVLPGNQCSTDMESLSSRDAVRKPLLSKRSVLVLREECTSNGVSCHGKIDDLIARLPEFYSPQAVGALDEAGAASGPVAVPPGAQAPMFTKHAFNRIINVIAMSNIAEGIVASRGPLFRQQLGAGLAKHDQWSLLVASAFNNPAKEFKTLQSWLAYGFNPNRHPLIRTGRKFNAKFAKVSMKWSELAQDCSRLHSCVRTFTCTHCE